MEHLVPVAVIEVEAVSAYWQTHSRLVHPVKTSFGCKDKDGEKAVVKWPSSGT
jgi:hypothetical protein